MLWVILCQVYSRLSLIMNKKIWIINSSRELLPSNSQKRDTFHPAGSNLLWWLKFLLSSCIFILKGHYHTCFSDKPHSLSKRDNCQRKRWTYLLWCRVPRRLPLPPKTVFLFLVFFCLLFIIIIIRINATSNFFVCFFFFLWLRARLHPLLEWEGR